MQHKDLIFCSRDSYWKTQVEVKRLMLLPLLNACLT